MEFIFLFYKFFSGGGGKGGMLGPVDSSGAPTNPAQQDMLAQIAASVITSFMRYNLSFGF